jgi:hypothetical protein
MGWKKDTEIEDDFDGMGKVDRCHTAGTGERKGGATLLAI